MYSCSRISCFVFTLLPRDTNASWPQLSLIIFVQGIVHFTDCNHLTPFGLVYLEQYIKHNGLALDASVGGNMIVQGAHSKQALSL